MSLILHLFLLQRIILSAFTPLAQTMVAPDDNFISEIGNLFGRALRQLNGDAQGREARAAVLQALNAPEQNLTPREADRKEHAARTKALASAIESWVNQTCELHAAQQDEVAQLFEKTLAAEAERYAKSHDNQRENRPFGETAPMLFVQPLSVGSKFSVALINSIRDAALSEKQNEVLSAALAERADFQRAAFREFVVSLVDQELFLTEDQRNRMLEQFQSNSKQITLPFYAFVAQPHYLPYQPISDILSPRKADFLDERQKERLKDLTSRNGNGNENYIIFQASEGPEEWQETIKRAVVSQRKIYLHATAVRIGYLERSLKLSPEQVAWLTVASKGATTDALAEWKETTQATIQQMQEQMGQHRGQNFAFSAQNISIDGIDDNQIWANAVSSLKQGHRQDDRRGFIHRARAGSVVALLDQELWLLPQQRSGLLELTSGALPHNTSLSQWDQWIRELLLIAYPLHKTRDADVQAVLSESQLAVWQQLKSFFRWNQGNNYIEIPLKNQGGSFQVQLNE
ncbi:MAG: hypothetical protein R3C17_09660 [Planctomycetaceae bacterium]